MPFHDKLKGLYEDYVEKPLQYLAGAYPIQAGSTYAASETLTREPIDISPGTAPRTSPRDLGLNLQAPSLQPYTPSEISISSEQQNLIDLINQLVTGEYGAYKQMLTGEPDYGLLTQAVLQPAQTALTTQTLPAIADIYSGGPYGASYWSGGRQAAQERAVTELAGDVTGVRYQAAEGALDRSLQAMGLMPSMMETLDIERETAMFNAQREMQAHYLNQGLTMDMFRADVAIAQQSLSEAGFGMQEQMFAWEIWQYEDQVRMQQEYIKEAEKSSLWGGVASIAGMIPGILTGNPLLAIAGSQFAGGLGQTFGGSPISGYQTLQTAPSNYLLYSYLQNQGE